MKNQPPSGGCVLKQEHGTGVYTRDGQPPSGGCVLKLHNRLKTVQRVFQPPSGGCVLKPDYMKFGAVREISRLQAAVY